MFLFNKIMLFSPQLLYKKHQEARRLQKRTGGNAARLSIFNPNLIIIFTTIIYVYVRRIDMKSLTNMNILYSTSLKRSGPWVLFFPTMRNSQKSRKRTLKPRDELLLQRDFTII